MAETHKEADNGLGHVAWISARALGRSVAHKGRALQGDGVRRSPQPN